MIISIIYNDCDQLREICNRTNDCSTRSFIRISDSHTVSPFRYRKRLLACSFFSREFVTTIRRREQQQSESLFRRPRQVLWRPEPRSLQRQSSVHISRQSRRD